MLGTVVAYSIFGPVNWAAVAVLIPATALGGYAGARLARRLPAATLRIAIVTVGVIVGAVSAVPRALTRARAGMYGTSVFECSLPFAATHLTSLPA